MKLKYAFAAKKNDGKLVLREAAGSHLIKVSGRGWDSSGMWCYP